MGAMAKLDANLDACRISSEILQRLRNVVRDELRAAHGDAWEKAGINGELHEFLTQRRAREASINWNLSDSCDLLDYAGFANLYEVIVAAPRLLERFLPLAPDANLLKIRFLELDTILNRVGYARPVSEADLGLLASFDDRTKRSLGARTQAEGTPRQLGGAEGAAPRAAPEPASRAPHAPPAPASAATSPPPKEESQPPGSVAPKPSVPTPSASATPGAPFTEVTVKDLEAALRRGDDKPVLTALYQEVTALADGLWNGSIATLQPRTWERVCESTWYHEKFVKLGLRPISDFFGLFDAALERMRAGASRNELQDFLKDHNFVQVLLALKELFRKHMKA